MVIQVTATVYNDLVFLKSAFSNTNSKTIIANLKEKFNKSKDIEKPVIYFFSDSFFILYPSIL